MKELQPLPLELVPEVLKLIREKSWPDSVTGYNKLNGHYTLLNEFGYPKIDILTPCGEVDDFGTFVLIIPAHRYELHVHTLHPDLNQFASALVSTPHIDWTKSPTFSCARDTYFPLFDAIERNLPGFKRIDGFATSFHIRKELGLKLEVKIPDHIKLDRLKMEHAEEVNRVWPHGGTPEAMQEVLDYIQYRPSVGLFEKDSGALVAWSLYGEYGGPALLQVAEGHKRKGYGEIALGAITRTCAEMDLDAHAFIVPNNVASMGLFTKLGYEAKYIGSWTTFVANKST